MPLERYTIVTVLDKTATKLTNMVIDQDLESVAEAIDYAADVARDPESLSEAELAGLLHRKLTD